MDPTGCLASGEPWNISIVLHGELSWFLPRPVTELLLYFTAAQEQIACSELGACLELGINIVFVQAITHLFWMGCYDTTGR